MIQFFFEDPRAGLLALFAIVCIIVGSVYRFFIVGDGLKYLLWIKPIPMDYELEIAGLKFVETCNRSPEQYDVYYQDRMIGYVRYRFGYLSAEYPDVGVESVFERELDQQTGQMTDKERGRWLPKIAGRLRRRLARDLKRLDSDVNGSRFGAFRFEPVLGPGSERYFVYRAQEIVGFVERRHGLLVAEFPDQGRQTIFEETVSDQGRPLLQTERATWFPKIAEALRSRLERDEDIAH